ncbi:hypothetical protein I4U23_016678 [Adineta vaga]|nr:hypothetical protein I4U23_016678 [Adineta vaga]
MFQGINGTRELNIQITQAGDTTSFTFINIDSDYYGCHDLPGMDAIINVTVTTTGSHHLQTRGHKLPVSLYSSLLSS